MQVLSTSAATLRAPAAAARTMTIPLLAWEPPCLPCCHKGASSGCRRLPGAGQGAGQVPPHASSCRPPTQPPSALPPQVSQQRLEEVRKELAELQDKLQPLMLRYQQEKQRLEGIRQLQKKKEELLMKLQEAENRMDLAMVADIKWVLYLLPGVGHAPNASDYRPCL